MLPLRPKAASGKRRSGSRRQDQSRGSPRTHRLLVESLEPRLLLSGYAALQRPTELQYWDASKADNGYNFFGAAGTTYLLDMEGKVVHTWPVGTNPHLLSNGDVLDAATDDPSGFSGFKEVNWAGTTVWSYLETRSTYHPHHDFTRVFDPKLNAYATLYIANKDLTYAQLIAAGANPATTPSSGAQMDAIVEVDMSGTIVWEWDFFDHLVQDYDAAKSNYVATGKTLADYPGRLNINLAGHNLKSDWLHCNSLDYNQSLDQIVINSVQGEFYVIDHGNTFIAGSPAASIALAATSAGDFLYRFGDPARYNQGSKPSILADWTQSTTGNKQLGGAHDIQWIADGLTGAGHFLIFDNAQYLSEHTSQSYVMEINPYLDASGNNTGHYVNPPDAGYNTVTSPAVTDKASKLISKQVVWDYSSQSNLTLFSQIGCSAQRLPNGNTLICADTEGYIMEVTPTGQTVWDYIVPVTSSGIVQVIGDNLPMVNSIFRAYRYEASYSAFSGHTLTPGATIAGRTTVANPYAGTSNYETLQRQTETRYWDSTIAYNGYTLFAAHGISYLIDMQGRVTHTWATGTDPRLLDSGNLLDWATDSSGNTGLKEFDWNGNTAWQYYETRSGYHPHGDFRRIYDPKLGAYATLYLANRDVTSAQCIAAGCDSANAPYSGAQVDTIVEVDMSGNVVWEWSFWDHAIQSVDATKLNYVGTGKTIADFPGKINLNLPGHPLQANWLDCNSLDYNQSLDQIVVNSRQGEFYIIDHGNTFLTGNPTGSIALAATTAGDFLYRFGDPARYSQGNPPSVGLNWETATSGNKQIGGSANVQWIASGLPGAGHLLVFDNNQYLYQRTPQSYVFEINPYLNSSGTDTGGYVNPPAAGYSTWTFNKDTHKANQQLSKQVVWTYGSLSNLTLFSHFGSSAQRLPNGDTLICATTEGYVVEVDASGNVVWEYINPVTNTGIVTAIGDCLPMTNAVPRATRYATSFSGLQGHSLTPGATIAGNISPTITGTAGAPTAPLATDAVWVTSRITDDSNIASATLTYSTASGAGTTVTMYDDGAHGDGTAGDHVYGGQIPAMAAGTTVSYYVSATDNSGFTSVDPAAAPTNEYSYTVQAGPSHPYTMAALPDTGQVASYSTNYGEDSDYTVNPPTYKDNGNGTVTDKVTGLMWQQVDGGEMTWEQAVAYAQNLSLGGYTDWRLPFSKELYTLMDESAVNPAMNTTYFSASTAEYWWSSDVAVDDAAKVWVANAGGGIGPHPKTETISAGGTRHFNIRCVRDPSASGATHLYGSLTNNGDGTVTDNHTGLVWQQAESTLMTWEEAVAYAENLTLASHGDWRLPNIKELESLSDTDLRAPSLDKTYFPGAIATRYWSSTTLVGDSTKAWYLDSDYGLTTYDVKTGLWRVRCVRGGSVADLSAPAMKAIPAGSFVMGDHFGFVDPGHTSDELPLHTLSIDAFCMGTYDITNRQYCTYLNSALAQGWIEVRNGLVYAPGGSTIYCETRQGESALFGIVYSGIDWSGTSFSVLSGRDNQPMVGVRWEGTAAYCNWLSAVQGYQPCYNLTTWVCDFTKNGYRLPTEAEWEYAANGGHTDPYYQFPWGSNTNTDGTWANWENSGDPYETGDYPWTTPVGFYDGTLHLKSDFNWPGSQTSYQTSNAANGFGLYDMGGNVWQWVNDWYSANYYSVSPSSNPTGPTTGDPMPDGLAYHGMRGGEWYNGAQYYGMSRISNRDPGYYRGPQDPNHPYYHVGFRVALKMTSLVAPGATDKTLVSALQFGEGPAADSSGNVYFSDVKANTIYKWSAAGQLSTFRTNSGGANGLAVDASGNVIACEGTNGRVVSISPQGVVTVLASQFNGTRFNEPNDLWIDSKGGIYFTDPVFFGSQVQDAQGVYYINSSHTTVTRVISDMVKPNGLVGTASGTTLYVSDYGAGATYKYTINSDGTLSGKTLFASVGSDGMEIDSSGNVYLTTDDVVVYNSAGTKLETINVLERPTNLCFAGTDRRTLFITTEAALYSISMRTQGLAVTVANSAPVFSGTTRTPTVPSATDAVWVTSTVTDDSSVSSVKLTYLTGSGTGTTSTVFTETFGATAVKPWTGSTGSTSTWTVTGNYCELRTGANYVTSTTECGMEYKCGATLNPLTGAMAATTAAVNAAGTSGYVEFYVQTLTLDTTDGWTFQVSSDGGTTWTTRLSELTANSHAFQKYHYDLASGELVSTLKMRFQFTGGGTGDDDRIDVDQVTVTVTTGSTPVDVIMYDDGAHGDGAAGDHVYGGQIPAKAAGTTVSYYVTATDGAGLTTTDPATAPTEKYSYIVGHTTPQLQLNEFLADSTTFTATTDYPTQTLGLTANTGQALAGYTLLDPMHNKTTYLIDNNGQVVHTWTSSYEPGRTCYLMPNGHLFRACMAPGGLSTGGGEGGRIEERDWDGNLVWYLNYATSDYMMHHDFKVLPSGNILMLVAEKKLYADVITAGFNPSLLDSSISTSGFMVPDSLVEIQPTAGSGGTVVWQWHVWDHLIQDYSSSKSNYGTVAAHPELINANAPLAGGTQIPQFWNHINGIDYNATLDQIMLSARNENEVWIIDHSTTTAQAAGHTGGARGKGGDLLYRWGNPQEYGMGTAANEMLYQQHNAQWIPAGYPGAGDILVFNNGLSRPAGAYSTIDQFTPPIDSSGNYTRTAGSAYGPTSLSWTYVASPATSFYSAEISGAERLSNGDTLICEGNTGRIFEVNSAGQIVWQYQNPVCDTGILEQGSSLPADPRGGYMTAVFRAVKYPTTYAAFTGRTLTPSGKIETYPDWIEIRNPGASAVDMSGLYLTNDASTPKKFQVPTGISIPAGGYLVFWADNNTSLGSRHMNFTLSSTGGAISLYDIDGITRIDTITYAAQTTNVSYGRLPNGAGTWQAMPTATPGVANPMVGDANLDGKVDVTDLAKVLTNYNQTGRTWADGDFDGGGMIDIADLTKVLTNYNQSAGASAKAALPSSPSRSDSLSPNPPSFIRSSRLHDMAIAAGGRRNEGQLVDDLDLAGFRATANKRTRRPDSSWYSEDNSGGQFDSLDFVAGFRPGVHRRPV